MSSGRNRECAWASRSFRGKATGTAVLAAVVIVALLAATPAVAGPVEVLAAGRYNRGMNDAPWRTDRRFSAKISALWEYGSLLDPTAPGDPAAGRRYIERAFPQ